MELTDAELLGWRFPGLRRLAEGPVPELVPCSRCGSAVSRALDPRGHVLGVEFEVDEVYVHACLGYRPREVAESEPEAVPAFGLNAAERPSY